MMKKHSNSVLQSPLTSLLILKLVHPSVHPSILTLHANSEVLTVEMKTLTQSNKAHNSNPPIESMFTQDREVEESLYGMQSSLLLHHHHVLLLFLLLLLMLLPPTEHSSQQSRPQ